MARKGKLCGLGSLLTFLVIPVALIIGFILCYVVLRDRHYQNSPGDWRLLQQAYRGRFCTSYTVKASVVPVIGTNAVPMFDLYQGLEKNTSLSGVVKTSLDGSNPMGDTPETRMITQTFHLTNGSRVRGSLCGSYYGKGKAPGVFVAVARSKSDLDGVTNNSCSDCIFTKYFSNVKCRRSEDSVCPSKPKPPSPGKHQYSFSVNETGDFVFGYFYPESKKRNNTEDTLSGQPNWMMLERKFYITRMAYDKSALKKISSNKLEAKVSNFSNSDSLLMIFKTGYPANVTRDLPYANIDVIYRCNPTIWLYVVVFFIIPLVVIVVMWLVLCMLMRKQEAGSSGLLSSEDG